MMRTGNYSPRESYGIEMMKYNNSVKLFSIIEAYFKFELGFALISLCLSILLLFIGTYAHYEANMLKPKGAENHLPFFHSIMHWYGINETNFTMLQTSSIPDIDNEDQAKLHIYQSSMVFVAAVSILMEIGLICIIIFEHLKLSILYNIFMISGLLYHLLISPNIDYPLSFVYQVTFLVSFCFYSVGIVIKSNVANQMMKRDIELIPTEGRRFEKA